MENENLLVSIFQISQTLAIGLLGECKRRGCKKPRVRNPRTGVVNLYCSLRCCKFEATESKYLKICNQNDLYHQRSTSSNSSAPLSSIGSVPNIIIYAPILRQAKAAYLIVPPLAHCVRLSPSDLLPVKLSCFLDFI